VTFTVFYQNIPALSILVAVTFPPPNFGGCHLSTSKYYITNAPETTRLEVLAQVASTRFRVEEFLEDAKTYLGMTQYETRSWTGWHHHMSLVALAHLFITLVRKDLRKETPALTLDRTVRLLKSALKLPHLDEDHAVWLVDYYVRRNDIARKSHEKTWMAQRPNVKLLPL